MRSVGVRRSVSVFTLSGVGTSLRLINKEPNARRFFLDGRHRRSLVRGEKVRGHCGHDSGCQQNIQRVMNNAEEQAESRTFWS